MDIDNQQQHSEDFKRYKKDASKKRYRVVRFKLDGYDDVGYWLWKQHSAPFSLINLIRIVIARYGYSDWLRVEPSTRNGISNNGAISNYSKILNDNIRQKKLMVSRSHQISNTDGKNSDSSAVSHSHDNSTESNPSASASSSVSSKDRQERKISKPKISKDNAKNAYVNNAFSVPKKK